MFENVLEKINTVLRWILVILAILFFSSLFGGGYLVAKNVIEKEIWAKIFTSIGCSMAPILILLIVINFTLLVCYFFSELSGSQNDYDDDGGGYY